MLRIIDEEKSIDVTAKYALGQEVCVTSYQGYRKGVITGISAKMNEKGVLILYTVELYVGKKQPPKIKKCAEKAVFLTPKEALAALAALAERDVENASEDTDVEPKNE